MEEILKKIELLTGVSKSEILSRSQRKKATYARHLAMYTIFLLNPYYTQNDIGRLFKRDKAAVSRGISQIESTARYFRCIKKDIENLINSYAE